MINILGINISTLNKKQILEKIRLFLYDNKQHQIVTANPEFLLQAQKDEEFFHILNMADLAIPDGIGLKFAAWAMGKNIHRFSGADLVKNILELRITNYELRIGVINWKNGLSQKENIEKVLREQYKIKNFFVVDVDRKILVGAQNFAFLQKFRPDILFCALGAPWQEKFIYHNLSSLPSVKLAIGVGGTFDFLTGKIKRAPKLMRIIGLEWFWRLIKQPWRARRIYNAVIVFPWKFFKWRFINKFFYRRNVVGFIFNSKNQVLLVNWIKNDDYWGLPQGGVNSRESENNAILRELKEEININNFDILGKFKNIYKYKWPKGYTNSGYKGQKQTLFVLRFNGKDSDIKLCPWEHKEWKWVDINNLINEAHQIHSKAYKIFLKKFNEIKNKKIHLSNQ